MNILNKIFGDPNIREIKKLEPLVEQINQLEPEYEKLKTEDLKPKTEDLKKRFSQGESLDDLLPEAFAVVREAAKRTIGQRHYDQQLIGGIVLHQGKIAEMKTGEGKTLVASLPLYLNALTGQGCHLVAPNDYLSRVGGGWMGPIYHRLGISVAAITHDFSGLYDPNYQDPQDHGDERLNHWRPCSRHEAYGADITYGTNNEFGFDYLRDNMAISLDQLVQTRGQNADKTRTKAEKNDSSLVSVQSAPVSDYFHYAIVDEVDSILIDEARTPLIISAPAEESASLYSQFAQMVRTLKPDQDYNIDEKERAVSLTAEGMKKIEKILGLDNIYDNKTVRLVHHLDEALKAHTLFKKNKDYVVKDGEIVIVDEFTGRLLPGRRYSEGLHQAIEAKEGVEVKRESDTLATISFQNLFRLYSKLAGMTGTALTEAEEFYKIYHLEAVAIPTHRPVIRIDHHDVIYKTESAKYQAIVEQVKRLQHQGQPVLIGTISIAKNEILAKLLKKQGIKHQILNAKHHEKEAKIIAQAGCVGTVTLATNMAGRGVDILLGGSPPAEKCKMQNAKCKIELEKWQREHQKVIELGGLYVIGTERHEARRIDNQLRGRAGRQGDPGQSQFYVSMEDDLMRIFGGERMKGIMDRLGLPDDQPIQQKMISGSLESAQKKVEGYNFEIRKHLVEYDDVMNKHREVIYRKRRRILQLDPQKDNWLDEEIKSLLNKEELSKIEQKEKTVGQANFRQMEKMVYLRTIDMLWIEHLNTMTELREGIGLRGYGQRDPLVEYKEEAYHIFQRLLGNIENQVVEILVKLEIRPATASPQPLMMNSRQNLQMQGAADSEKQFNNLTTPPFQNESGVTVAVRQTSHSQLSTHNSQLSMPKVGRNEPCPCGSGKKYKKCHGR